jgi:hypothetical protein
MSSQGQRLGRRHCCRKRLGYTVVNVITNGGHCNLHHRSPLYLVYSCLVGCSESSPSFSSVTSVKGLTRRQTSLLIRLRTGHAPLNRHLWAIKVADSPGCSSCKRGEEETVRHFLLSCPAHERARIVLRNKIGARSASNISALLTERKFLRPLFTFVDSTGRFRDLLGTITGDAFNRTVYDDIDD